GLRERVRPALALVQRSRVEAAVAGGGGVSRWAVVGPGDRVSNVNRERRGRELEVRDRVARIARGVSETARAHHQVVAAAPRAGGTAPARTAGGRGRPCSRRSTGRCLRGGCLTRCRLCRAGL